MVYSCSNRGEHRATPRFRYEKIADDLAERIATGEFPPGPKLPSRRELIEHYALQSP